MSMTLSRRETLLLFATLALASVATVAPPLAQPAHFHDFADQRSWFGIPHALDVLSNVPFALFGLWGLRVLGRARSLDAASRGLGALFFGGLIATALASGWYHWAPMDAGLAADRLAMTVAFAGLLGLGVRTHISARAGLAFAAAVLLLGPVSVGVWAAQGNLLPWALLQGGGMALLLVLAWLRPQTGQLTLPWAAVIGVYVVAKVCELGDHAIYEATGQAVSGHSLKHLVAALAAWPVITALQALGQNAPQK